MPIIQESKAKSSIFNRWYFILCVGSTSGIFVLCYIQDNLSCGLGSGIPCIIMGYALLLFLSGTRTNRFGEKTEDKSAFVHVFVKAARNRRTTPSTIFAHEQACGTLHHQDSHEYSIDEVEQAKAALRLIPIWVIA